MTHSTPGVLIAGLQRRLLVLVSMVLLPVFGFFIMSSVMEQRDALGKAGENLRVVARLSALGAEQHVEGTRQLLNAVTSAPSLKNNGLNALCNEFLANIRSAYPYYTNLAFMGSEGGVICHALTMEVAGNYKDRSYFAQAMQNSTFAMGNYQVGQVTGVPSLGFGMPVYDREAKLKGVAYAGLELKQLALALQGTHPPGVSVTLTDRNGTILVADPSHRPESVGTHLADEVLVSAQKMLPGRSVEALDPSGVMRLYAVAAVADDTGPGMYVLASMPRDAVTAPAWQELRQQLLLITSVVLLGILLARWVADRTLVEPTRQLIHKINQMGQGEGSTAALPAIGHDEILSVSSAFDRFAQLLKLRNAERDKQQRALEKMQASLLAAQRIAKIGNWEFDLASQKLWWSDQTYEIFGLLPGSLEITLSELSARVFADDLVRYETARSEFLEGKGSLNLEHRVVTGNGRIRWFHALGEMQRDSQGQPVACSGTIQDITKRIVNEHLLAAEARTLKALSLDMPLKTVLDEFLIGLEPILPGAHVAISLISPEGKHMRRGAAPHVPAVFTDATDGLAIGPEVGSCGTAAYRAEAVVVEDISTSPLWVNFRDLALSHGFLACWSIPVLNASGAVMATFAAYYKHTHQPHPEELALAHSAAHVIGVAVERERKAAALRASELRFRNSFQGAATGMAISNLEGQFVQVNDAYCQMTGYSAQELYVMDMQAITYSKDWPQILAQLLALVAGEQESFVMEKRCRTKTGTLAWVRVSVSLLRNAEGQPEGFIGIAEDINVQRQALEQLRLLETAVSRLNDIVLITEAEPFDEPGPRIVFVNDAFERRTGYSREEAIGQTPRILQGPNTQRAELKRIGCALRKWQPVRTELINYTKSGQEFWLELDIVPIANAKGWYTHWVAVERDITQRKQAQIEVLELNAQLENRVQVRTAQLEAVNRELEAFSYSVSHDLRSPLNTVNGFGQLLQKSNANNLNDKGKHYLNRIRAGTQQMGELIEGLLSLAKLSRNALHLGTVDLSAVAVRVEQELREREPERQVTLHIQPGLNVRGDATLLLLVMQNLLSNAWKYTSKQADARIDVGYQQTAEGETVYFVRDNGAGFDMAHADKLFGAFQRLHAPSDFAGTGVGLANVRRVIERHGGRVWAEGHLHEGATFFFTVDCPDA